MRRSVQFVKLYFILCLLIGSQIVESRTILDTLFDISNSALSLINTRKIVDQLVNFFSCSSFDDTLKFLASETDDPDSYRNVSELITSKGYPLEEHTVRTEDGYLLSVQRITYGRNDSTKNGNKEVVLLIHGELGDGKTWFLNPPHQSLGYILPDAGYDVWVLNARGSTYSKKNVKFPTRSNKFWDFSFDEIAKFDVTATIDYILKATGKESLTTIGFSRGTTVNFVLLSEVPEYNKKVKLCVALSPVAYLGHFTSAIRCFTRFAHLLKAAVDFVTRGEFLPTNRAIRCLLNRYCGASAELCQNVMIAVGGPDTGQWNMSRVPIYTAQYPSSTSTKILNHYAQLHLSKKFRKYDYGLLGNLNHYSTVTPPEYQLSRIKTPIALIWSTHDAIADIIDVGLLRKQLKSVVLDYKVPENVYNHFDFIIAKNAPDLIYKPLLTFLKSFA